MTTLSGQQVADAGLEGWVLLLGGLQTRVETGDFATGLALVDAIGAVAAERDHHPDLDLRYTWLGVRLRSHDVGGVTTRDVRMAHRVSALAREAGLRTTTAGLSRLEMALDTPAMATLLPFWSAVLASPAGEDEVPGDGTVPAFWFQPSGSEEPRQRWHPDLWVDPAEVQPRIDAALAAGGRLVSDEEAPSFWVLADPEGNQVCLCTWQGRD